MLVDPAAWHHRRRSPAGTQTGFFDNPGRHRTSNELFVSKRTRNVKRHIQVSLIPNVFERATGACHLRL
jgi:hypothetical protein